MPSLSELCSMVAQLTGHVTCWVDGGQVERWRCVSQFDWHRLWMCGEKQHSLQEICNSAILLSLRPWRLKFHSHKTALPNITTFHKSSFSTKHEWYSFYEPSYLPSKIRLHPSCKIPISLPAPSIQSLEGWHGFFLGLNHTIIRTRASAVTLALQGIPLPYRIFWS